MESVEVFRIPSCCKADSSPAHGSDPHGRGLMDTAPALLHGCGTKPGAAGLSRNPVKAGQLGVPERFSLSPDAASAAHDAVQESMP
jgi:hypothetical protein